jgi:hypothetical protein
MPKKETKSIRVKLCVEGLSVDFISASKMIQHRFLDDDEWNISSIEFNNEEQSVEDDNTPKSLFDIVINLERSE